MSKSSTTYPEPVAAKSITEQIDEHKQAIAKLEAELAKQAHQEYPKYIPSPVDPTLGRSVNNAEEEKAVLAGYAQDIKKAAADKDLEKKIQELRDAHAKGAK